MHKRHMENYNFFNKRIIDMALPMRQTLENYKMLVEPFKNGIYSNQELIKSISFLSEGYQGLSCTLNSLAGATGILNEMQNISHITGAVGAINFKNDFAKIIQPLSVVQSNIANLNMADLASSIKKLKINQSLIVESIQGNLEFLKNFNWEDIIEENNNEDIKLIYDLDDISLSLEEFSENRDTSMDKLTENLNFQQQIITPILKFKEKNPVLAFIIFVFIISPLMTAIGDGSLAIMKKTVAPIIQASKRYKETEKELNYQVIDIINSYIDVAEIKDMVLKSYYYVSTEELIIRQNKKVKSRSLYKLEYGQVVKVLRKNRNWTLIEYENDEDIIQGWVFTRYISKFKK